MGLDIRYPIGMMFTLIGGLMVIVGIITGSKSEVYARSLGININLIWGVLLLAFGLAMYFAARAGSKKDKENQENSAK